MYYNQGNNFEYNECSGRGMCSITPTVSAFQEVMLIILQAITYYSIKLEEFGLNCSEIKHNIVDGISNLISTNAYTDEQLLNLVGCYYNDLIKLEREYIQICKKENKLCREFKLSVNLKPDMVLSDVLKQGQNAIRHKNNSFSKEQKFYSELLFQMLKSVSLSILKLSDYKVENENAVNSVLAGMNLFNQNKFQINKAKDLISELAKLDLELWKQRKETQIAKFGIISKSKVSLSTEPGKAVLVSGSNLMDLYEFLEKSENVNIDIYSHGDLLISHAFENFKKFKNFKGHFGSLSDNCILDFATFPGAILLTKHATQNIEYLIRGRLFTTDDIAPKGVIKVENNDYTGLIEAANLAKGFSKGKKKEDIHVGFDVDDLSARFDNLKADLDSGKIKRLFIIGMANMVDSQAQYFESLLKRAGDNTFVISFSYDCKTENSIYINIANNFPAQLSVLDLLFDKISITDDKLIFFLTKCDSNTLSSIISLKNMGAKNIYLSDCPPTIINPTTMESFIRLYNINKMTTAKNDVKDIL